MPLQQVGPNDNCQLQDIADIVSKSHRILIISGAGISTSCGIPDFRSKKGLYNIIPERNTPPTPPPSNPPTPSRKRKRSGSSDEELQSSQSSTCSIASKRSTSNPASKLKGQDLFNSRVFQDTQSTSTFYRFIAAFREKVRNEVKDTSLTHKFIRALRDGGRLIRCYTQNIDGLEGREGLCMDLNRGMGNKRRFMRKQYEAPRPVFTQDTDFDNGCEVVQLHGDLDRLRCSVCSSQYKWTDDETAIFDEGTTPSCPKCETKSQQRQLTGKRGLSVGGLRPNIVLYGEDHPFNSLLIPFIPFDVNSRPEVLIVMGTSLKVFGLQKIIREFSRAVHSHKKGNGRVIFVNRTRPAESVWDGIIDEFIAMDCDTWVDDLKMRRPDIWLRQGEVNLRRTKPYLKRTRRWEVIGGQPRKNLAKKLRTIIDISAEEIPSVEDSETSISRSQPPCLHSTYTPHQTKTEVWKEDSPIRPLDQRMLQHFVTTRSNPSPVRKSIKPMNTKEAGIVALPGSPWTPEFSPITPRIPQTNRRTDQTYLDLDEDRPQTPCHRIQAKGKDDLIRISSTGYEAALSIHENTISQHYHQEKEVAFPINDLITNSCESKHNNEPQHSQFNGPSWLRNSSSFTRFRDLFSKAIGVSTGIDNSTGNGIDLGKENDPQRNPINQESNNHHKLK